MTSQTMAQKNEARRKHTKNKLIPTYSIGMLKRTIESKLKRN